MFVRYNNYLAYRSLEDLLLLATYKSFYQLLTIRSDRVVTLPTTKQPAG